MQIRRYEHHFLFQKSVITDISDPTLAWKPETGRDCRYHICAVVEGQIRRLFPPIYFLIE